MFRDSAGNLHDTLRIEVVASDQLELPYVGSDGKSLFEAPRVIIEGNIPLKDGTPVAVGTNNDFSIAVIGEAQIAQGALLGVTLPSHATLILDGAVYMSDDATMRFEVSNGRLVELVIS